MKNTKLFVLLLIVFGSLYACQKDTAIQGVNQSFKSSSEEVQLRETTSLPCCEVQYLGTTTTPWGSIQTQFSYKYPQATAKLTRRTTFTITRVLDGQSWSSTAYIQAGVPYCTALPVALEPAWYIAQNLGDCQGYYTVSYTVEVKQGTTWSVCSSATSPQLFFGTVPC